MTHNDLVSDLPRWALTRTAKLATLPVGLAGRTALGLGKRLGGRPAEIVATEIQQRTAEQIFRVLGELKGGAMKFGQALSIFEAALPPEIAGPYRATLTRLQESAPPLPSGTVHGVLAKDFGPNWRDQFAEFSDKPAAAASIGQVHRARWRDGRDVAVKIQYPGAGQALLSDFTQLSRVARLFSALMPGLEVRPVLDELRARVAEELDYPLEASAQRAFAAAYAGDPDIFVPDVVAATDHVLVTEWMDGTPLSKIISEGSQQERDRAGLLFVRFLFSGPMAGWGCWTSARWTGCRTGSRRSSATCSGSSTKAPTLPRRRRNCAHRGSSGRGLRSTRRRCVLSWPRWRSPRGWSGSGSAGNGSAARPPGSPIPAPPTWDASSTCRPPTCSSTG